MTQFFKIETGVVVQKQPYMEPGFIEGADDVYCGYLYNSTTKKFTPPPQEPSKEPASPVETEKDRLYAALKLSNPSFFTDARIETIKGGK